MKVQPLVSCLKFCTSMLLAQFCLDNKYKKCKAYKFLVQVMSNKLSLKICFGVKRFENLIVTHFYNFKKLVAIEASKVTISEILFILWCTGYCGCVCGWRVWCGGRGSRQDMAAMAASPSGVVTQADHNTTLMEDPDVWRPT